MPSCVLQREESLCCILKQTTSKSTQAWATANKLSDFEFCDKFWDTLSIQKQGESDDGFSEICDVIVAVYKLTWNGKLS